MSDNEKQLPKLFIEVEPEYIDGDVWITFGLLLQESRMNGANRMFDAVVVIEQNFLTGKTNIKTIKQ